MNWKNEAVEKLKQYIPRKLSLNNIPLEINRLESSMEGIRSTVSDGSLRKGSAGSQDDMYLSNMFHRGELERAMEQAASWVDMVEAALEILSDEERLILERFYMRPEKGAADRLAGDLRIDVKTVYRKKDDALRRFTIAMYGCTES